MIVVVFTIYIGLVGDSFLEKPFLYTLSFKSFFRVLTLCITTLNSIRRSPHQRQPHRLRLLAPQLGADLCHPRHLPPLRLFLPTQRRPLPGKVPGLPDRSPHLPHHRPLTRLKSSSPTSAKSSTGRIFTPSGCSRPPCSPSSSPKNAAPRTPTPLRPSTWPSASSPFPGSFVSSPDYVAFLCVSATRMAGILGIRIFHVKPVKAA